MGEPKPKTYLLASHQYAHYSYVVKLGLILDAFDPTQTLQLNTLGWKWSWDN